MKVPRNLFNLSNVASDEFEFSLQKRKSDKEFFRDFGFEFEAFFYQKGSQQLLLLLPLQTKYLEK